MAGPLPKSKSIIAFWLALLLFGPLARAAPKESKPEAFDTEVPTVLTLAQATDEARKQRKALIINVGTSWCGTCKLLKTQVLNQDLVKQSLKEVVYVYYDAERQPGKAAAKQLLVTAYPTLIALAQDGSETARIQGVPTVEGMHKWLVRAAAESEPTAALEERIRKNEQDGVALLILSRRYGRRGESERSKAMLEQALRVSKGKDERVAGSADWGLRMAHLRRVLREEPRQAMIEHLLRYPRAATSETALISLSRLGPADDKAKKAFASYIDAHLGKGEEEALNRAVYACLRASAFAEAERAARHLRSVDPNNVLYMDTLAEVLHLAGDSASALALSNQALATLPEGDQEFRQDLKRNRDRFLRKNREPPQELRDDDLEPFPWEVN